MTDIERDLDTLKLRFLGFQVSSAVQTRFLVEHPGQWLELAAWKAFEVAHPDTVAAMYQFLVLSAVRAPLARLRRLASLALLGALIACVPCGVPSGFRPVKPARP